MTRTIAGLLGAIAALSAQTAAPRFEVASIKPTPIDQYNGSSGISSGHGRINGNGVTLKRCIIGAYGVGPSQIIGGPPWLDTDRFEIAAKADGPAGDGDLMIMLQTLLADRFKLAIHRETRPLEALVLEVAKNGPKLEKAEEGANSSTNGSRGSIVGKALTMSHFAWVLSRTMNVPVVDGTGLAGAFNLTLQWSPDADKPLKPGETGADTGPSIYTAIQQQLGLRLQARKTPIEVVVIDHAEKPTEN
jgi:uncharacterized protein (TIGR03435 family)